MKGVIAALDNGKFTPLAEITHNERTELKAAIEKLNKYEENYFIPYSICWYNLLQYRDFHRWAESEGKKSYSSFQLNSGLYKVFAAQNLINMLTSFRSFSDITAARISHDYGKQGLEYFHSLESNAFDKSFSYRFIYKLRNYSQHYSIPIAEFVIDDNFAEDRKYNFKVTISRDRLLADRSWGKITNEIEKLPERITINEHIEEYNTIIQNIHFDIIKYLWKNIKPYYEVAMFQYNKVREQCNFPLLGWPLLDENGKPNYQMDTVHFPTSLLEMLEKVIDKMI